MDQFVPATVTVAQGEKVTWSNVGGRSHNVAFDDGFIEPSPPSTSGWSVSRTFAQAGTFKYVCQVHAPSMAGTVVVTAAGGAPPGGGGGGGGTTTGDARPVSSLRSASRQDVDRLFVRASMNEAGTLTATATVKVPGAAAKLLRFKRARRDVAANTTVKLRLKLAKKNLRAVKRALRTRRLSAKVAVTATDSAGQTSVRRQTIRLTR